MVLLNLKSINCWDVLVFGLKSKIKRGLVIAHIEVIEGR